MKKSIVKGAIVIAVGGLLSKIIGAFYRVPLTNIIGAEGIGLYQMVFPVYCALLTLSSTGIPTALSKLVAEREENASAFLVKSLLIFGAIGFVGSVIMFVLGDFFAKLQGNGQAGLCYKALSPSVFTVSLISCVRGFFQGKNNMLPTSVSQVVEQIVKAVFGVTVCRIFSYDVRLSASLATFAVTLSEAVALIYLLITLKLSGFKREKNVEANVGKKIFKLTLPVALSAIMLPLGNIADSFIVVNNLSSYTENATSLFGIYSGSVSAIIGLPISVAYGVAVATVPAIAGGGGEMEISESLKLTAFVAVPSAMFLLFFAPSCIGLLYGGMTDYEQTVASQILMLDAVSVISLSFLQTVNSLLISSGKQRIPVYSLVSALVLRVVLCLWFTSYPQIGILGAVISSNLSHLLALGISCFFALKKEVLSTFFIDLAKCFLCAIICVLVGFFLHMKLNGKVWFVVLSVFVVSFYIVLSRLLGIVDLFGAIKRSKKVKAICKCQE